MQRFTHATLAVFAEVCVSSCTMTAVQVGEASDSESLRASVNALNTSRLRSLLPLKYYTGSMRGGFRNEGYLIGVFIKKRESYYLGVYVRGPLFSQTPMWLKQHPYAKVEMGRVGHHCHSCMRIRRLGQPHSSTRPDVLDAT